MQIDTRIKCSVCPKSYKTIATLKQHQSKTNCGKQLDIVQQVVEIPLVIIEPIQQQIVEVAIEQIEEQVAEDIQQIAIPQLFDNSINLTVSEILTTMKIEYSSIQTQTDIQVVPFDCGYWIPKIEMSNQVIIYEPKKINRYTLNVAIPTINVMDIKWSEIQDMQITMAKLCIKQDYNWYNISEIPLLRLYKSDIVNLDNRVQPLQQYDYQTISYSDYPKYDKKSQKSSYLNVNKTTLHNVIAKLKLEVIDLQFIQQDILLITWDIETYNAMTEGFPTNRDLHSKIAMISIVYYKDGLCNVTLLIDHKYRSCNMTIFDKVQEHCNVDISLTIVECQDQADFSINFQNIINHLSLQQTCIVAGFNSNSDAKTEDTYQEKDLIGYDLPFILRKLGSVNITIKYTQHYGQQCVQVSNIDSMPNTYFVDFKLLFAEDTQFAQDQLEGRSLNDYLKFYQIPEKMEASHTKIRQDLIVGNCDVSNYASYCIYDSLCLQLVDQKKCIISQKVGLSKEFGLPLSCGLYNTDVQNITTQLQQQFYNNNYMFTFSNCYEYQHDNTLMPKCGATTKAVPEELRYKTLQNVNIFDFESQYPNAGIQNNISPENLVTSGTITNLEVACKPIDIYYNYTKQPQQFVQFYNRKGIISEFQRMYLEKRQAIKKQMKLLDPKSFEYMKLDMEQLATKKIVNSMYGMQNQNYNPLYNYFCGSAITGYSRYAIDQSVKLAETIFENKVLFIDTDSLTIQCDPVDLKAKHAILQKQVMDLMPRMNLQNEATYQGVIYPKNKKSYAQLVGGKLTTKGIQKNCFTIRYRDYLDLNVFRKVLTQNADQVICLEICNAYIQGLTQMLQNIVANNNVDALQMYTKYLKKTKLQIKSGALTKFGYLQNTYPEIDQFKVVAYNTGQSKQTHNYCPIEHITSKNIKHIKIQNLVNDLTQPIRTFFKMKSKSGKQSLIIPEVGNVSYRTTFYGSETIFEDKPIDDLLLEIANNGNQISYHEYIKTDINKLFFDIESSTINIVIYNIIQFILDVIKHDVNVFLANASNNTKQSYHVIFNIKCNRTLNKFIGQMINERFGLVADLAVYASNHTMRLPNCVKYENGLLIDRKLQIQQTPYGKSTIKDFIITDITECIYELIDQVTFDTNKPISDSQKLVAGNIKSAVQCLKNHNIDVIVEGYQLIVQNKPYNCPFCSELHESDNMKFSNAKITCYAEDCIGSNVYLDNSIDIIQDVQPLDNAIIMNQPNITYNLLQAKITYIKSHMGTGKTEQLTQIIPQHKTIIAVSFRRTFTDDFCSKLGFENYQDIAGIINLSEHPKICIQIDSLHRINVNIELDLFITDEVESILSQMNAFDKENENVNMHKMLSFFKQATYSLVMDAILQQSTIDAITKLTGVENINVIVNEYQPKSDHTINYHECPNTKDTKLAIVQSIQRDLDQGLKLVINCTGIGLANQIKNTIKANNVFILTGDDNLFVEQNGSSQKMSKHKLDMLQDVNKHWKNCDVLIYTGTITAGVSFTQKHFDKAYCIWVQQSTDIIGFIQGNHRIRDLSLKVMNVYIFPQITGQPGSTCYSQRIKSYNVIQQYNHFSQIDQFRIFLRARKVNLANDGQMLYKIWSKSQGYNFVICSTEPDDDSKIDKLIKIQSVHFDRQLLTEVEFKTLPRLAKLPAFVYDTDPFTKQKLNLIYIANLYKLEYNQLMALSDADYLVYDSTSNISIQKTNNLIATAKKSIGQSDMTIEQYEQLGQQLLADLQAYERYKQKLCQSSESQVTAKQTEYKEHIIQGLKTYHEVVANITLPGDQFKQTMIELLQKKQKDPKHKQKDYSKAIQLVNHDLKYINYMIDTKACKQRVDGKQIRVNTYTLVELQVSQLDESKSSDQQ